jgi:predicted AAA+ superfamily ATPase
LLFRNEYPILQGIISRWITNEIKRRLEQVPSVALLGARQVGKTTLAKSIAKGIDSIYLDLEAPEDLFKLSDPAAFLSNYRDKLVILDEIQRMPDLFPVLRGLIDKNREQGRKSGQFLFLGSASMDLMHQSSESLAGRISYIYMGGLNIIETGKESKTINALWVRGGFPESYLAADNTIAMDWLEDLIRTYLERDLPQLGFRVPAIRMRRLWTMLAHLQGEPVNYSKLGRFCDGKYPLGIAPAC